MGSLATVIILSACSVIPPPTRPVPHGKALHSYFVGAIPATKEEPSTTRPVFSGGAFAQAHTQAVGATTSIGPDAFLAKTIPERSSALMASYFDDGATFVRYTQSTPRRDSELPPELQLANAPPADIQIVAIHVEPPPLIALSLALNGSTQHRGTVLGSSTTAARAGLQLTSPFTEPPALNSIPAAAKPAQPARFKLDLGDTDRPDVYSDLVSFANGSIALTPAAVQQLASLVEAAHQAQAIQLRGRVGNRQVDPAMARFAVARAIAVRSALEARGVPRSKIRIHMPRNADFIVAGDPAHEANRSVSIFMVVPEAQATALGLRRGKPTLNANLGHSAP